MNTVTDKIQQTAHDAEHYAKGAAATAQGAGHDLVDSLGKVARVFFATIGLDAKTPIRMLDRLGLEPRRHSRIGEMGAFTAGAIVGGGAALLFAPMSGAKLRQRLREQIVSLINAGDGKVDAVAAGAKEIVREIAHGGEAIAEKAKSRVETIGASATHALDKGQAAAHTLAERIDEQAGGNKHAPAAPVTASKSDGSSHKAPSSHS